MGPDGVPDHVAVYLGFGECIHATKGGVSVVPLGVLRRSNSLVWIARPSAVSQPIEAEAQSSETCVLEVRDIVGRPYDRTRRAVDPGQTLESLAPDWANLAITSTGVLKKSDWSRCIETGEVVVFARSPGEPVTFFIALVIQLVGFALQSALTPKPGREPEEGDPGFSLSGFRNTSLVGIAQPVVYGIHRQGGNIISAFQRTDGDGRSRLHLMTFLSRGPVEAVGDSTVELNDVSGSDLPTGLEINGNEASAYPVAMSTRLGTSDQDYIPGFGESVLATTYDVSLKQAIAFVAETSDLVDAFEVVFRYPVGLYTNAVNGGAATASVVHSISYRLKGSASWSAAILKTDSFGRRNQVTTLERVENLVRGIYEIQVTRVTANSDTTDSQLADVNEITNQRIAYTGKAVLALKAFGSDTIGGSVPTVTAIVKGRKVWVWDGVSETSPFFNLTWTDNPAWIVAEMLTNKEFGLGRNGQIRWDDIDLASFADWASYCDEVPEVGNGKRATCDILVDQTESGWQLIVDIAAGAFCSLVLVGSKVRAIPDRPTAVSAVFSMGNVKDLEISYVGNRARPNTVEVQYVNEETNYESESAVKTDSVALAAGATVRKESIRSRGITRPIQANRLAKRRLNAAMLELRAVSFTTSEEALHLLPMDVFRLQHDASGKGAGGRVLIGGTSTVKVDATISTVAGSTCYFRVISGGQDAIISGVPTATDGAEKSTLTFGTPLSIAVSAGDPYAFGIDSTGWPRLLRIRSITIEPDLRRRIEATEYVEAVYDDDPGEIETFTDTMPDPLALPARPTQVRVTEEDLVGCSCSRIRVDWTRETLWTRVDIWTRTTEGDGVDWLYRGRYEEACELDVVTAQEIEISVAPVNAHGGRRQPDDGSRVYFYPVGSQVVPDPPQSVYATVTGTVLHLEIVPPSDSSGVDGYEVRYNSGTSAIWSGQPRLAIVFGTVLDVACPFTSDLYIYVRSRSANGVLSATSATVRALPIIPTATYTAAQTVTDTTTFTGTKTNTVVSGGALVLDGSNLEGTYVSNSLTTTANRIFWSVSTTLENVERRWSEHLIPWNQSSAPWNANYLNGEDCSQRLRWKDCAFPWNGLIGSVMTWRGWPDVVSMLTPTLESRINSGTYAQATSIESTTITQSNLRLTIRRPHERYVPKATAIVGQSYTWTTGGGGSGLTHPQVAYRIVVGW